MMLLSDSVGGADASRNGFSNRMPVNIVDRSVTWLILLALGTLYALWKAACSGHDARSR